MNLSNLLTPDTRLRISPDSYAVEVDNEVIILNFASEQYYGLSDAGVRIWNLIGSEASLGEIHLQLMAEYDVESDALWHDIYRLVEDMLDQQLITLA